VVRHQKRDIEGAPENRAVQNSIVLAEEGAGKYTAAL
jgi:hypothetical protein